MDYRDEIQEFLKEFEKEFKLNLQQLNWVDQRLEEVYSFGLDDGQNSRSEKDYDEGYSDAKDYFTNEDREDEFYDDGYKKGYEEAKRDYGIE